MAMFPRYVCDDMDNPDDVRGKWYVQLTSALLGRALFLSKVHPDGADWNSGRGDYHQFYFDTREEAEEAYASWLLRGCPVEKPT